MKRIRVGDVDCAAGELAKGGLPVAWLEDSTSVRVPLVVVNGQHEGPTLFVSGTMHGNEIVGIEVLRRLTRERVNPHELRRAIVACPILHPIGYRLHQALTPRDGMNLIGAFPGDPDGSTTQQIAAAINQGLLAEADYVIDVHSNPWPSLEWTMTAAAGTDVGTRCFPMAESFGLPLVEIHPEGYGYAALGTMLTTCMDGGKPSILVELTANRRIEERPVEVGVRGLLNVLRRLDMLDGEIERQTDAVQIPERIRSFHQVKAHKGGIVHRTSTPGAPVKAGDLVARVIDPWGDVVEETRSPVDGYVMSYACWVNQAVQTGGYVVTIGGTAAPSA